MLKNMLSKIKKGFELKLIRFKNADKKEMLKKIFTWKNFKLLIIVWFFIGFISFLMSNDFKNMVGIIFIGLLADWFFLQSILTKQLFNGLKKVFSRG